MDTYIKVFLGLTLVLNHRVLCDYNFKDLVFTSPIKIRTLLTTQTSVAGMVDEYINNEQNRIQQIQDYVNIWKKEHENHAKDKIAYLSNPLNVYHLFKKLTVDWQQITKKAKENNAQEFIDKLLANQSLTWPDMEDLEGIQDVLLNIQNINLLKASDLVAGKVGSITTNFTLSYDECYTLSKRCKYNLAYKQALDWALRSLNKYFKENINDKEQMLELLFICSWSSLMLGDYQMAYRYIHTYSFLKPNDPEVKRMQNYLATKQKEVPEFVRKKNDMYDKMKELCSGSPTASPQSDLRCKYNFKNSPFLTIAPLKEELLSSNPKIVLFHDVIYDSEIEKLVKEAMRKLQAKAPKSSGAVTDDIRLDDSTWFGDGEFEEVDNIARRVTDMTSMHRNLAQPFQISNYGVGGYHYEHSVVQHQRSRESQEYGPRLATVAFNLNDVLLGGATIFPQIGMKVELPKGDALVWVNTRDDGTEDTRVRHAICPVLSGCKWVLMRHVNEKKKPRSPRGSS